jgi:hypothetical protein
VKRRLIAEDHFLRDVGFHHLHLTEHLTAQNPLGALLASQCMRVLHVIWP